ncbi:MAG: sugar MFS transporter [Rhizomicrobium sp.]
MAIQSNAGVYRGLTAGSLRGPLSLAIGCFLIWGLAYGLLDVLNKHFQETLHVGKAQSSWLQIAYFGAYLVMSIPAGSLMHARGYKFSLVSGLMMTAAGAFLFVPAAQVESFAFFVAAMFVLASGLCVLETAADTYVSILGEAQNASRRLNLAQSFNALGVFIGPVIGGSVFFNDGVTGVLGGAQHAVQITYLVIGVAVLAFALVMARAHLPEIADTDRVAGMESSDKPLLRQRHFVFGVITQAFYIGAQVGVAAFFINLTTETWHGTTSQAAAYLLSLATLAYLFGRFITTALLLRVSPRTILALYGIINVALCLVAAAGIEKVSALALVGVFFFMGTMFPTIFTLGIRDLGKSTKRASSIMVMAIGGGAFLPYPMGLIGDAYGMPAAFLLPAAGFALVAWYGLSGAGMRAAPAA